MCGIAGVHLSAGAAGSRETSACQRMLRTLEHRGPDAEGIYHAQELVLGHRRFSIIDLSQSANQPITNEDGTVWLACNGEIYNFQELREELEAKGHRFKSKTDSEVIVHLYEEWGPACLSRLHGMFAFALWDERKKQLLLARDRLGIKPLYYAEEGAHFIFASEARAVVASHLISDTYDLSTLAQFLRFGSIPEPFSAFQSVRMLPAGHYLLRHSGGSSLHSYWNLGELFKSGQEKRSGRSWHELLQDAVRRHLTSDVPAGILLSGGLDSSALVALASRVKREPLHTLTVGFEETAHDESKFARLISQKFRTTHHECRVGGGEMKEQIGPFIEAMDQPTVDGLNTFVVTGLAFREGLRVLLSGLGADEAFGGYSHFRYAKFLSQWSAFLKPLPYSVRSFFWRGLSKALTAFGHAGAVRLMGLEHPTREAIYHAYRGLFPAESVRSLLDCDSKELGMSGGEEQFGSTVEQMIDMEYRHYLRDQLLRDTDVMSMSHPVEVRVPFLDEQFLSELFREHGRSGFRFYRDKVLLKEAFARDLPASVLARPKQGFIFPMDAWLRGELKSEAEEVFLGPDSSAGRIPLRQEAVRDIWHRFLKREIHWSLPWALYILRRWQNRSLTIPRPAPLAAV